MDSLVYDYVTIEQKWQNQWFSAKIFKAQTNAEKKFFLHFAYPGVSGYLHVGHMRGFTYCDVIARYKRMHGYSVLYPAGFHASGIPSVGFAKKVERNDPSTIHLLQQNGLTKDQIQILTDPQEVVKYFSTVYVEEYWKRFGFLIDYSRLMNTISEGYKRFITWQFHQLKQQNLLIQKPHHAPFCPNCGPVAVDKSETDVSKGGASEILEFTILKFTLDDGTILPAATLRPETIFGVTNMWVNPEVEYEKIKIGEETWICSHECVEKLSYQFPDLSILKETISGKDLIGQKVTIPLLNTQVPVLPGPFADPCIATGIVMSVPAHAPYDYIALQETGKQIEPISLIDVPGFSTYPAKQVCEQLQITNQQQQDKLDQATEEVYKKEFHTGTLNERCGSYQGIKVSNIKDQVKNDLIDQELATVMKEFSEEVICRCGSHVIIKQIPDQWFIKYSDERLTKSTCDHVEHMHIFPQDYQEQLPKVLDWFDDRAVIRKGSWLGTEFPFKKGWVIEPISDSSLYSIYYCVSKYLNDGTLQPEDLSLSFFDYVFLGKGTAEHPVWDEVRQEVKYWYPIDINLGGKEHKTVHFPVYLMNHVAILPKQYYPKGIFVHWWVTQRGKEKISKSKGGAEPIHKAAETYGVDAMRLYYSHVGSPFVDIEWAPDIVIKYKQRLHALWQLIHQLSQLTHDENQQLDQWLQSSMQRHIQNVHTAFSTYDLRVAANEIYFELSRDIQWYLKRQGSNTKIIKTVLDQWIGLMTPFTPHLAEELWHHFGHEGFVSTDEYPQVDESLISEKDEVGEYLLSKVVEDINEIIKVTKMQPETVYVYTAPNWKQKVLHNALDLYDQQQLSMGVLMKQMMQEPSLQKHSKSLSKYAGSLVGEIKKLSDTDRARYQVKLDEQHYLQNALEFLREQVNASVVVISAEDDDRFDPENKARFAVPLRPAIYLK